MNSLLFCLLFLFAVCNGQNKFMNAVNNATQAEKNNGTKTEENPLKSAVQKYINECGMYDDDGHNFDSSSLGGYDFPGNNYNNNGDKYDGRNYRKKNNNNKSNKNNNRRGGSGYDDDDDGSEDYDDGHRRRHTYAKREALEVMSKSSQRDGSRDYGSNRNRGGRFGGSGNRQGNHGGGGSDCGNDGNDDDNDDDEHDGYSGYGGRNKNRNSGNNNRGGYGNNNRSGSGNRNNRNNNNRNNDPYSNRNTGYGNRNSGYGNRNEYGGGGSRNDGNEYGQRPSYAFEDYFRMKRSSDKNSPQVQCLTQCVFGYLEVLNDNRMPSESAIIKFLQDHVPNEAKRIKSLREARKCFGRLSTSDSQDGCEFSRMLGKCLKLEIEK